MPKLQTSGGLCYFLRLSQRSVPSPALLKPHTSFVAAVAICGDTAARVVPFGAREQGRRVAKTARGSRREASFIGVAQEDAVLKPTSDRGRVGHPFLIFSAVGGRQPLAATCTIGTGAGVSENQHLPALSVSSVSTVTSGSSSASLRSHSLRPRQWVSPNRPRRIAGRLHALGAADVRPSLTAGRSSCRGR